MCGQRVAGRMDIFLHLTLPICAEQHVMKGSVLDKRRKKEGAGLSASAGYAKKMAEMAAAQYNSQRQAQAAQEDDGEQVC